MCNIHCNSKNTSKMTRQKVKTYYCHILYSLAIIVDLLNEFKLISNSRKFIKNVTKFAIWQI